MPLYFCQSSRDHPAQPIQTGIAIRNCPKKQEKVCVAFSYSPLVSLKRAFLNTQLSAGGLRMAIVRRQIPCVEYGGETCRNQFESCSLMLTVCF